MGKKFRVTMLVKIDKNIAANFLKKQFGKQIELLKLQSRAKFCRQILEIR